MHNFNAMRDYVNELMVKDAKNKQDLQRSKNDLQTLKTELSKAQDSTVVLEQQNELDEELLLRQSQEIAQLQYAKRPSNQQVKQLDKLQMENGRLKALVKDLIENHEHTLGKYSIQTLDFGEDADQLHGLIRTQIKIYEQKLEEKTTHLRNMDMRHNEEVDMIKTEISDLERQIKELKMMRAEDQQKLFELKREVAHLQYEVAVPEYQEPSDLAVKVLSKIKGRLE